MPKKATPINREPFFELPAIEDTNAYVNGLAMSIDTTEEFELKAFHIFRSADDKYAFVRKGIDDQRLMFPMSVENIWAHGMENDIQHIVNRVASNTFKNPSLNGIPKGKIDLLGIQSNYSRLSRRGSIVSGVILPLTVELAKESINPDLEAATRKAAQARALQLNWLTVDTEFVEVRIKKQTETEPVLDLFKITKDIVQKLVAPK